jgi:hypothetical protein
MALVTWTMSPLPHTSSFVHEKASRPARTALVGLLTHLQALLTSDIGLVRLSFCQSLWARADSQLGSWYRTMFSTARSSCIFLEKRSSNLSEKQNSRSAQPVHIFRPCSQSPSRQA